MATDCCAAWRKASEAGTDNEGWSSLVWHHNDGRIQIGVDLPQVMFCPWCGAAKSEQSPRPPPPGFASDEWQAVLEYAKRNASD